MFTCVYSFENYYIRNIFILFYIHISRIKYIYEYKILRINFFFFSDEMKIKNCLLLIARLISC